MFPLDFDIQKLLMKVAFPLRLFKHLDILFLQPASNHLLQFLATNPLSRLLLLGHFKLWLKPRLHPYPEGGAESDIFSVSPDLLICRTNLLIHSQEFLPLRLYGEGARCIHYRYASERLFRRDGLPVCEQHAKLVAAQIAALMSLETEVLRARHFIRGPNLSYIVGFGG